MNTRLAAFAIRVQPAALNLLNLITDAADGKPGAWRRFVLTLLLSIPVSAIPTTIAQAASSPDVLWSDATPSRVAQLGARQSAPERPRAVTLDLTGLKSLLGSAPELRSGARGVVVYLPMPDGGFERFEAFDSDIMEPGLAKRLPEIRNFVVVGLDDPSASGRINYTPAGFHGIVIRAGQTVYIDPYRKWVDEVYVSYTRREYYAGNPSLRFECGVPGADYPVPLHQEAGKSSRIGSGVDLRSYRIAVAGTTEFTADQGGAATALASVATTVMQLNAIYERELAVHFDLVANNANIIYSGVDPYSNGNPVALIAENQANLDNVATIGGSGAYDIGHVIGTWPAGGSGVASLQSVCNNVTKGRGSSSSSVPSGEPFVVDLMAHEIGHQFDANHTFNGTTANCGGGNRNASTAWEPGSGTTIMSYAGICGSENIQTRNDAYFHLGSLQEMTSWVSSGTGASCGTLSATGNTVPSVDAGVDSTIPVGTPFELTGTGNDDDGDSLTFTWEQFDLGNPSPPNTDDGTRPIFRSLQRALDPSRTFPQVADILTGSQTLGESLPVTDRTLTFRLTARDNAAAGGGTNWDEVLVTSTTLAGPFAVISFPDGGGVASGATATIEWDVANTDLAPVACANVDIDLSTDGGATFSHSLAADQPNGGSATVQMPEITTTQARVRVGCSDGIFFAVNGSDFAIGATVETVCATPALILGEATTASDSLSIAGGGEILDVNVSIDATMATFASTAGFEVSHLGTDVTLTASNPSCFGDDINVTLDDEAGVDVANVCSGSPAINGIARPVGSLADLDTTDRAGTWTLTYTNNFLGCGPNPCAGTLNEWCITTAVALAAPDTDGDGVDDSIDNCTNAANADQRDTNADGFGNACDADLNNDCNVNFLDLGLMKAVFFTADADADLDGDGSVNFLDLGLMKAGFFLPPGPSGLPNACD